MVLSYKCPGCGAVMAFDEQSQLLVCPQCDRRESVDSMKEEFAGVDTTQAEVSESFSADTPSETDWESLGAGGAGGTIPLMVYKCSSCGADLMTDEVTAATFCSFCGNSTLIADRVSGEMRPSRVIPFQINKDNAVETFRAWTKKGLLTPSAFRSQAFLDKISGIYVPFWLYDYDTSVSYLGDGHKVRTERRGDYRYTHTDHYDVYREVGCGYEGVPADASKRMEDAIMDCLEPYHYEGLKPFEMPYLSGFYAEKNSYSAKEMSGRVLPRIREFSIQETEQTIYGYASIARKHVDVRERLQKTEYVLLPVWLLNYTYKGKQYTFALNGQTGKMVGTLPVSGGRATALFGVVSLIVFGIMMLFL